MTAQQKAMAVRSVVHLKLDPGVHRELKSVVAKQGDTMQAILAFLAAQVSKDPSILSRLGYRRKGEGDGEIGRLGCQAPAPTRPAGALLG